jgi:hypothetical protein
MSATPPSVSAYGACGVVCGVVCFVLCCMLGKCNCQRQINHMYSMQTEQRTSPSGWDGESTSLATRWLSRPFLRWMRVLHVFGIEMGC